MTLPLNPDPCDGFADGQLVYDIIQSSNANVIDGPVDVDGCWCHRVRYPDGSTAIRPVRQLLARVNLHGVIAKLVKDSLTDRDPGDETS